jgi:snurportin-1
MDDLADKLDGGFSVGKNINSYSTDAPHPRFAQFKRKSEPNAQNKRRHEFLERQKNDRTDAQALARKIAEDDLTDIEEATIDVEELEEGDPSSYSNKPRKQHRTPRLMLSEWLVDIPDDFVENCYIVPCPVGKRNLVTSSRGYTSASTKYGIPVMYEFPSALPNAYTLIDCIYCPPENKYYALDLLCWNGHTFLDCETEFRFFWLQSKFMEYPEMTQRSRLNPSPFERLPFFPCSEDGISQAVNHFPPGKLDGLWFFHKKAHYHLGVTPLVGWLKPYMVPEMLSVEIPEPYCVRKAKPDKPKSKPKPEASADSHTRMEEDGSGDSFDALLAQAAASQN